MSGPSHLGPFRDGDPAYALALPIEHVAVGSDVAAEPAPVFDAMVADRRWSDLLDRRRWWTEGKGAEPITWAGVRAECDECGRHVALRRDGTLVLHGPKAARCPGYPAHRVLVNPSPGMG